MKILLIHQYFLGKNEAGGSRWNEITKDWEEKGIETTVIAGMVHYAKGTKDPKYKNKFFVEEQYSEKVNVIRCHVSESYNVNFLGRLWAYFSFVFSGILAGTFKAKDKYDLIIVSSPPLFVGFISLFLSKIKNIPYLFEIRDLWPESAIDTKVLTNKFIINLSYKVERLFYKNAILINALTPAFKEKLIKDKNIPESKIIMIPNAADFSMSDNLLENFDSAKFKKDLGLDGKLVIVYVGAHGRANGLDQILETAKILKNKNVIFLLIGDGMEKQALMDKAKREKIENVQFVGSVPKNEVFKYILASDIGTSVLQKNDTFKTVYSNKTFDYMSCKKPILMAIDGVSRDLVENAKAGFFVEPENPEDFAEKVNFYLDNPQTIKEQGENGYNFAKKNFDRKKLAIFYLENLKKCTEA